MGIRLKAWQWAVLVAPIGAIALFILIAAGSQIQAWGLTWIWALFTLVLVGWRWLLVRWTRSGFAQIESTLEAVTEELEATAEAFANATVEGSPAQRNQVQQAEAALQRILQMTQGDRPLWEDWPTFWQRCRSVVVEIAHIYHPEVKYPLLNIYVPQAYALIRGTTDDMDQWMQKLAPALNQVTVGQAYQAYETYRKLEPSARKLWKAWTWVQWVVNPAAAIARTASQNYGTRANQQLLFNLSQLLREAALRNLAQQAIVLYSGDSLPRSAVAPEPLPATLPQAKTETLRAILDRAEPTEQMVQQPLNILLVGRTGAGKSSVINTLFSTDQAVVDVLPSTDQIQNYSWQIQAETLNLWDTPGYEQVQRADLRELVLDYAQTADLLLLVTPALDPALQMDVDFLQTLRDSMADLPVLVILTQVDRLRPVREWEPPYDWLGGDRPKERAIREATQYRIEQFGALSEQVLPVVTGDRASDRAAWNAETLALVLLETIDPAKQLRLARFLRNQEARTVATAKIIDQYVFQMATTQGLTALLKSPVLQFLSTLTTGSPALAQVLLQQIPVEKVPIVVGKLQMAYDLFALLKPEAGPLGFDLLRLWPLLLEDAVSIEDTSTTVTRDAWAFGHGLVEYWSQDLTVAELRSRFEAYKSTT